MIIADLSTEMSKDPLGLPEQSGKGRGRGYCEYSGVTGRETILEKMQTLPIHPYQYGDLNDLSEDGKVFAWGEAFL